MRLVSKVLFAISVFCPAAFAQNSAEPDAPAAQFSDQVLSDSVQPARPKGAEVQASSPDTMSEERDHQEQDQRKSKTSGGLTDNIDSFFEQIAKDADNGGLDQECQPPENIT